MRLRDLGQFAAHLHFPLVPFLKREQGRAAKVDDPVKALEAIHKDFEWPYLRIFKQTFFSIKLSIKLFRSNFRSLKKAFCLTIQSKPTSNSMSKRLLKDLSRSLSLPDTTSSGVDPVDLVNRSVAQKPILNLFNPFSSRFEELSTRHQQQHVNGNNLETQQRQIQFEELSIASLQEAHLVPLGNADTRSLAGFSEFSERSESVEGSRLLN